MIPILAVSIWRSYIRKHSVLTARNHSNFCQNEMAMDLNLPPKVTPRAFARLAEINADTPAPKALRVAVEGGGCSGFQYDIRLDDPAEGDLILEDAGQKVVVDETSLPFLANAVIDFSEELIGARFVIDNPNAASSCGCGISFSL
jgi:iron-sulfur cluster assembly accessory protein